MDSEHTYPPYASYTLLRLFINLKKKKEKPTPLMATVVAFVELRAGVTCMFKHRVLSLTRVLLVLLHTVKPSYPKSSFSVIAAAMPAGLPRRKRVNYG